MGKHAKVEPGQKVASVFVPISRSGLSKQLQGHEWRKDLLMSGEVLQVQQGSLYPALHRLEQKVWIKAKWAETETGRKAKFYSLTAAGRAQLEKEAANWSRLSAAINLVVETT